MKKTIYAWYLFASTFLLLFSCRKDYNRFDYFRNPLQGGCQVAEYHIPIYDEEFPPHFTFLFKKTFDAGGKIVKSIECNFWDDIPPSQVNTPQFRHNLRVEQNGLKVYLINKEPLKAGVPDTVARITLNKEGRAISCAATGALNPDYFENPAIVENYKYKNDRIIAVKSDYFSQSGIFLFSFVDSVHYDNKGNISSFAGNSYQYDYTQKVKQQFYCDDFMGSLEPFYLLQYLGFFPEVNSPENVRTHVETVVFKGDLTNHQFDDNGRLTSYDFYLPITISWNCGR